MRQFDRTITGSAVVLGSLVLSGCATQDSNKQAYPTSPPASGNHATVDYNTGTMTPGLNGQSAPGNPSVVKVPPDAVDLSHGDYPPPAFPTPDKPGLILVVDMDADPTTAVASTAVTGQDAGKMMSITDIANMSVTMNKLHKFKIVFVPGKPTGAP